MCRKPPKPIFVVVVAINVIANVAKTRVDLTADKMYTLSDGTKKILAKLDTFRGRISPDQQAIAGTWIDAGSGNGRWSVALVKQ